jgi:hypothetical protein
MKGKILLIKAPPGKTSSAQVCRRKRERAWSHSGRGGFCKEHAGMDEYGSVNTP